jgi:hypothetical protein
MEFLNGFKLLFNGKKGQVLAYGENALAVDDVYAATKGGGVGPGYRDGVLLLLLLGIL